MECMSPSDGYKDSLKSAISAFALNFGFDCINSNAIETLVELAITFFFQIGITSRNYAELSGRTKCTLPDCSLALIDFGLDISTLPKLLTSDLKPVKEPGKVSDPPNPKLLASEWKKCRFQRPSHIPDYLPEFPEPHTYLTSDVNRPQLSNYAAIRQKAADERRRVELSLTRFLARTGSVNSLFPGDSESFPLIANQPSSRAYLSALLAGEWQDNSASKTNLVSKESTSDNQKRQDNPFLKRPRFPQLSLTNMTNSYPETNV